MPPKLPNEIWDQIWLERCKMGFEPRIVQAKWVFDGRFHVPAFYTAQPQPVMTQICQGARQVAAKEFYSRISDNPFTGVGGFWWNEKDVLYIDQDFYRQLRTLRMAIFMGRDYITRVAVDIEIDAGGIAMMKLLFDWFPRLSQLFFLCPAQLMLGSKLEDLIPSSYNSSKSYSPRREVRGLSLAGNEVASTKSLPITAFHPMGFLDMITNDRFRMLGPDIPFFVFMREDGTLIDDAGDSLSRDEGMCFSNSGHALIVRMLTSIPSHRNNNEFNDCQYPTL